MSVNVVNQTVRDEFALYHGDCVEVLAGLPDASVDLSVFSPPFGDLFVYSASERDMGNSSSHGQFFDHYAHVVRELRRVVKPGRMVAVHCSDLPLRKFRDGDIGLYDFSGDVIRAHQQAGFILHSKVTVWKDPVVEMQRTKALGLLYKQLQKDSTKSRMGMPDYICVFRVPGDNAAPVGHKPDDFPVDKWQQWASPVWMDIDQTNVLNGRVARANEDERHICPLQLDLIERLVVLYSNKGETVLSPFAGIGSEGYVAVKLGRKFVGAELKPEYWQAASRTLTDQATTVSLDLFAGG